MLTPEQLGAFKLGTVDGKWSSQAASARSACGARDAMRSMSRNVLGIASDPPEATVDMLADAYYRGRQRFWDIA